MQGKKLFVLVVLFLSSFLFVACDKTTTEQITTAGQTTAILTNTQNPQITLQTSNETTQSTENQVLTEPTVEIIDVTTTDRSIYFALNIDDVDDIYHIANVELRTDEDSLITLIDLSVLKFTSLLEDTTYTIVVKYNYNLNDGLGLMHKTIEYETKTKVFVQPNIQVQTSYIGSEVLQFKVNCDEDIPCTIGQAAIYSGSILVQEVENYRKSTISFFNLESDTIYHICLYIYYDLEDGEGERLYIYSGTKKTDASSMIEIEILDTTQSMISFNIIYNDLPLTGEIKEVSLLLAKTDEILYTLEDLSTLEFTGLDPDTEYVIYLKYENDGNDITPSVQKLEIWYTVKTLPDVIE